MSELPSLYLKRILFSHTEDVLCPHTNELLQGTVLEDNLREKIVQIVTEEGFRKYISYSQIYALLDKRAPLVSFEDGGVTDIRAHDLRGNSPFARTDFEGTI